MRAWIVRSLRAEGYELRALQDGIVAVGWDPVGDLGGRAERSQVREAVRAAYPFIDSESVDSYTDQLHHFRTEMATGDLVLLPRRSSPEVAAGWVAGNYSYVADAVGGIRHVRSVQWERVDLSRADVEHELPTISPLTMVARIDQDDVVQRLRLLMKPDHTAVESETLPVQDEPDDATPFANLRRNLGYARRLAVAGQHLAKLEVGAFEVSDVFRAAWVQAVAALDHWVREEIHAGMKRLASSLGGAKPKGFSAFPIPVGLVEQILQSQASLVDVIATELVRTRGFASYQSHINIKDGFRLISDVEDIWGKAASVLSKRAGDGVSVSAQQVKGRLTEIAHRRHKIAHESDMDPQNPPSRRPIDAASVTQTIDWIEQLAAALREVTGPGGTSGQPG